MMERAQVAADAGQVARRNRCLAAGIAVFTMLLAQSGPAPAQERTEPQPEAEPAAPAGELGILGTIQDWLSRANRDYQGVVIRKLSVPPEGAATDDAIARKLEEGKSQAAREAEAEAPRKAAEETARQNAAEAQRREQASETEAQRRADEEKRRLADEQRQAEARIAEERRRAEEAKAAEAQRLAEAKAAEEAKHQRRSIAITTEPIDLTPPRVRADSEDRDVGISRIAMSEPDAEPEMRWRAHRGTAVKRWIMRRSANRCRAAGRLIRPPARYTVRRGDSLWRIAERHYRRGALYAKIYRANRRLIRDPDLIYPCQRLRVPRRYR